MKIIEERNLKLNLANEILITWRDTWTGGGQNSFFREIKMLFESSYPWIDMILWADNKYRQPTLSLIQKRREFNCTLDFFLWWYTQTRNEYEAYDPNVKERLQQSLKELEEIL